MPTRQDPKSQRWYYRFTREGHSYYKSGFLTEKQAHDAEVKLETQIINGQTAPHVEWVNKSVNDICEWYLDTFSKGKESKSNDYARIPHIQAFLGKMKFRDVKAENCRKFLDRVRTLPGKLPETTLSEHTVDHYRTILNAVFQAWIDDKELNVTNPVKKVERKKFPRKRDRVLLLHEIKQLTEAIRDASPRLFPYYFIGLYTGMREWEICNMRVQDINFPLRQIFIPETKTRTSRYVPMSDDLFTFLTSLTKNKQPSDWAVAQYHQCTVSHWFSQVARALKFVGVTFHTLRHTFVTNTLHAGVPIYKVAKIIGDSIQTVQAHYEHLVPSFLMDAANTQNGVIDLQYSCNPNLQSVSSNTESY
jgi:integrase